MKIALRPIPRRGSPFDPEAAGRRLRLMGVLDANGEVEELVMSVFAGIFSGIFYDDLQQAGGKDELIRTHRDFAVIHSQGTPKDLYLYYSLRLDELHKPMPDPVWWLAGHVQAIERFTHLFFGEFTSLVTEAGLIPETLTTEVFS